MSALLQFKVDLHDYLLLLVVSNDNEWCHNMQGFDCTVAMVPACFSTEVINFIGSQNRFKLGQSLYMPLLTWPKVRRVSENRRANQRSPGQHVGGSDSLIIPKWLQPIPRRMKSLPVLANIAIREMFCLEETFWEAGTVLWHFHGILSLTRRPSFLLFLDPPGMMILSATSPFGGLLDKFQTIFLLPAESPPAFDSKCICPTLSSTDYMNLERGKGQRDRRGGSLAKSTAARLLVRQPTSDPSSSSDAAQRGWRMGAVTMSPLGGGRGV